MDFWKSILALYLGVSFILAVFMFIRLLSEDIRMVRHPYLKNNAKFGYNLAWGGIGWWMLLMCFPCINILVGLYVFLPSKWLGRVAECYWKIFKA